MMIFLLTLFLLPLFIISIFIPYWTRKTESFGVSIPEELYYQDDIKQMRKKYAIQTTLLSIVSLIIFLVVYYFIPEDEAVISIVYSAVVMLFIIASFLIYLVFHRQMKYKKQTENWLEHKTQQTIIHTKFRDQKLTISNWWYLIPIVGTIILIVITLLNYENLPDKIAMHYDMSGEVTRWADKSYGNVLMLPSVQLSLIAMFLFINIIIEKSKQQVSAENPDESMLRNRMFRWRWSVFMYITALLLTFMFSFLHAGSYFFTVNETFMTIMPILVSFITVIGALILSVTTGQGGSRITLQTDKDELVIDRDDDVYWKLGQFYFNKDDPSIFVEKRFGVGWTINFARPSAWITLIALITVPILIPVVLSFL